jgi:hypothetical protein|tara:strand:- start:475 stop:930 length:456 start_codon:yes stop_codon:yes gene_type:complete
MKELFNSLQQREKTLLILLFGVLLITLIASSAMNLYSNMQESSKKLQSSKSDYDYVFKKAEILSLDLANQGFKNNSEAAYTELDKLSKKYELINYVRTPNADELKIVYILNDLEKSLMFIEDSIKVIGITPSSIDISRLNEIKRFTIIFTI